MSIHENMMQLMKSEIELPTYAINAPTDIDAILKQKHKVLIVKRIGDVVLSLLGLVILVPLFALIGVMIKIDSPGPVFFKQIRIGKDGKEFNIYKFRKMHHYVGDSGPRLTLANDQRMTKLGHILRKYKLDELPQVLNVLKGDMSLVGPRPETPEFVKNYSPEQRKVLKVKPGITDYASIYFINEGELLEKVNEPESYYIETLMPQKIRLNIKYIRNMSFSTDISIIYLTLRKIFSGIGS